uniref:AraC family transcriptional regulator n=2 Tax=Roseivirga sp. TaxID=1964215 RepID=UPI004048E050
MKATLLKRNTTPDHSFAIAKHDFPNFLKIWHYHAALELVYIIKSEGTRFVGDNIDRFEAGELILLGSNLPHMYQNDEAYFKEGSKLRAEAHAIHFDPSFLKTSLLDVPEFREIHQLFERAKLGLKFSEETSKKVVHLISELEGLNSLERMIHFLSILSLLSKDKSTQTIANPGFVNHFEKMESPKLKKVYDYVMNNFQESIEVNHIADLVSMNKSSFCRYFKQTTQRTFTEFLNEVRIGFACKMLMEKQMSILEISYHSGYNNISHFNRQFRKKMQQSPTEYIQQRKNKFI